MSLLRCSKNKQKNVTGTASDSTVKHKDISGRLSKHVSSIEHMDPIQYQKVLVNTVIT